MIPHIKSFACGVICASLLFIAPALARGHKTLKDVEKEIDAFVRAFHCRIAVVEDVNLWERKVLVKVKSIRFVLTAFGSGTYEICPVGKRSKKDL